MLKLHLKTLTIPPGPIERALNYRASAPAQLGVQVLRETAVIQTQGMC
jgi:hypothetical protein